MDYSAFAARPFIRTLLVGTRLTLTDAEITGGVTFEESVNDGEELTFGSCVAGCLCFELDNRPGLLPDVTGEEFRWRQAVLTGRAAYPRLARAARPVAVCLSGNRAYIAGQGAPYLSVWDTESNAWLSAPPGEIAPTRPVEALVLENQTLYCLYGESPWLTVYSVSEEGFEEVFPPALTPFQQRQIAYLAAHGTGLTLCPDREVLCVVKRTNLRPSNLEAQTFEYVEMGYFTAEKPEKSLETRMKVRCYDRMTRFDQVVDDWLSGISYPMTLKAFLTSLCDQVDVPLQTGDFTNQDYLVRRNFGGENIAGRQVLKFIAEVAAGFCRMRPDGKLELTAYRDTGYSIDNTLYETLELAEYVAEPIDRVQLKVMDNDIGVIAGSGTNTYIIQNNALLYGETDGELRPAVTAFLSAVSAVGYRPYEVNLFENPLVRAGDILSVTNRSGKTFKAYVMNRKMANGKDTYEAVGERRRRAQGDSVNQSLQALRGKTHALTLTVEELSSVIADAWGNISSIQQTISGIETSVTDLNGQYSRISQTVNEISLDVNNAYVRISDQDGITVKAGGFRMQNLDGENVLDIDSSGNATFNGDISGSYLSSDSSIYFGGSRSGGKLYGWSGKPSNDNTTRVDATTFEAGSSMVLYAPKGVSIAATDGKQVAITNAGPGSLNVYGNYGIWSAGNIYGEKNIRGASMTLSGQTITSWDEIGGGTEGVSDDFFIESPMSGAVYKLFFRNGLLVDWSEV